jgi:hypothetical protein
VANNSGVWTSSNSAAAVYTTGLVMAIKEGIDTLYYTLQNSCGITTIPFRIYVTQPPDPPSITGVNTLCMGGAPVFMLASPPGGAWYGANGNIAVRNGELTAVHLGRDTIYYAVPGSCGAATASAAIDVYSRFECDSMFGFPPQADEFQLCPNPVHGNVVLHLPYSGTDVQLKVFDVSGGLIFTKDVDSSLSEVELPSSSWGKGVFMVKLLDDHHFYILKLVCL